MLKSEFVTIVSEKSGLSKKDSIAAIEAYHETIMELAKAGDSVAFKGFGTFATTSRKERTGRNPQTGESIIIPASVSPTFKPSKSFKDSLKN